MRHLSRLAIALSAWLSIPAHAQWSTTVAVDSDYRYRGVSLSDSRPSARITLNYDAPQSWYAGASASRVELIHGEPYEQLLGYGGYVTRADDGHRFEIGATYSHFTGDSTYDYAEVYAGVLADRWSARLYYAPDYFGRHSQSAYVELNAHHLLNDNLRLFAHGGALVPLTGASNSGGAFANAAASNGSASKTRLDLRVGAGAALRDWDLQLAWVTTSSGGPYPAIYSGRRSAFVASASYSF